MNSKSIKEVGKNVKKNTLKSIEILMQPFTHGFDSKEEALVNIEVIQKYLDEVNEKKKGFNRVTWQEFKRYLTGGVPLSVGSWEKSKRLRNFIQNHQTNIYCFNLNDISSIPPNQIEKVIQNIYDYCHFVQESYSSGKKLSEKNYHCYVLVSEECVGYEISSYVMERFRDDLGAKIGVAFDKSMTLSKNILPSGKPVTVNEDLEIYSLNPYLNEISRIEKILEKERKKISKQEVVYRLLDKDFNNKMVTSEVDFNNLLNAFKSQKLVSLNYREISYLFMVLNNLEDDGQITHQQKIQLADALKKGTAFKQDVDEFKNYKDVGVGSLNHILKQHDVATENLFTFMENHEIRIDLSFEINGKIYENKEVYEELKEILFGFKYRGKKIILISGTGSGKSYALTKMIHEYNERMKCNLTPQKHPYGFALYNCPRNALINNLQNDFESDGISIRITGSDKYEVKERESMVKTTPSFLTTIDHAPVIVDMKMDKQIGTSVNEPLPILLITDEKHVLSTDASYKPDAVRDYLVAEKAILNAGGVSLDVTATPQHLRSDDYDLIIKINQKDHQNPFKEAKYTILEGTSVQVEEKMLNRIQLAVESDIEKKLLVFIESTDAIEWFAAELKKRGIPSIGIFAKKEKYRSDEESMLIDYGLIPDNIQVILATTVLGSGISIVNNNENDETWILCSAESLNHNAVRIIQMSHRFRIQYSSLNLYFQAPKSKKGSKVFLYHTFLEEEIMKAENTIAVIKGMRRNPTRTRIRLDEMEREAGLFTDKQGKIHVCSPIIQSELILYQTYFNYTHPEALIRELEKSFGCTFSQVCDEWEIADSKLESQKINSTGTRKENLQRIANDKGWYDSLRREYLLNGRDRGKSVLKEFGSDARIDLVYFFQNAYDHSFVSNVMKAHMKANKDKPYSYIKEKRDYERVERIKLSQENSIEVKLYETVCFQLKRYREDGRKLKFSSKTEVDNYLKGFSDQMIKAYGVKPGETKFDVKSFRRLLNLLEDKKGGTRTYTIVGFKDQEYLKEKYRVEKVL
ncbi:DEAD/DEAH box helicase family protein [Bacillus sp. FJAT-49711]|uniref:DEAD/DEAH box helicase family protein n=1 Tax=Bacillus sp. FJAT-49711 TaxID=2833585 RepID=UPI001BC9C150|nr:DEAD/DEAH box helicase family protein [Bacillus sp. FJAT-49711]MBS4220072.1 DEAD/DEAH box helicase family protein [Bacillus sp. FJAT-49711]